MFTPTAGRARAIAASIAAALLCLTPLLSGQSRAGGGPRAGRASTPPRLVVLLVVDQMRTDYVERFQGDWTGGLKRMLTTGAQFSNTAYPYASTFTCSGHATISTGAFPYSHGIFQNTWFDRERGELIPCTYDGTATAVVYGGTGRHDGPGLLRATTFSDALRAQRGARVVSLSLKGRSAIMMAGHGGVAVTWLTESGDGWQTSTAYTREPVSAVQTYLTGHPREADAAAIWERLLPLARYPESDDASGEAPPPGWTRTFPHPLAGEPGTAPGRFRDLWQRSPWANAYLGRMAASLAESWRLGTGDSTDMLAVSFSSPDLLAHQFGPHSQEVRDMYARLDATIGELFARLDRLVGSRGYVVALTADHGVADIPEQARTRGRDAGRVSTGAIREAIEELMVKAFGAGHYVARVNSGEIYFHPGVLDRLRRSPVVFDAMATRLQEWPGVARVFRPEEIAGQTSSSDSMVRAFALSYVPDRSGDLLFVTKPGWILSTSGTTHGSAHPADQRVPLLLMGSGIRQGSFAEAATPADIAPTLARLIGIDFPRADGRPLTAALATEASPSR